MKVFQMTVFKLSCLLITAVILLSSIGNISALHLTNQKTEGLLTEVVSAKKKAKSTKSTKKKSSKKTSSQKSTTTKKSAQSKKETSKKSTKKSTASKKTSSSKKSTTSKKSTQSKKETSKKSSTKKSSASKKTTSSKKSTTTKKSAKSKKETSKKSSTKKSAASKKTSSSKKSSTSKKSTKSKKETSKKSSTKKSSASKKTSSSKKSSTSKKSAQSKKETSKKSSSKKSDASKKTTSSKKSTTSKKSAKSKKETSKKSSTKKSAASKKTSSSKKSTTTKKSAKSKKETSKKSSTKKSSASKKKTKSVKYIINTTLNIRSQPNTEADILGVFHKNDTVKVISSSVKGWGKITYQKKTAYIKLQYAHKDIKEIYLTFDDGPSHNTEKVLKILKKYKVKATFFVCGASSHETSHYLNDIGKAYRAGHAIGAHSYSHQWHIYKSTKTFYKDLDKIQAIIKKQTGKKTSLLRFPGGSGNTVSKKYAKGIMKTLTRDVRKKGYQYVDWNASCGDASKKKRKKDAIVRLATASHEDRIVLLMHDSASKEETVKALPEIIKTYQKRGYQFKVLNQNAFVCHADDIRN